MALALVQATTPLPSCESSDPHAALVQAAYTIFRQRHALDTQGILLDLYEANPSSTLAALPDKALRTHIRAAAGSDRPGVVSLLLAKAHTLYQNQPQLIRAHYSAALAVAAVGSCVRTITWLLAPAQLPWLDEDVLHNATILAVVACLESVHCKGTIFACRVQVLESLLTVSGATVDREEMIGLMQRRGQGCRGSVHMSDTHHGIQARRYVLHVVRVACT